MQVLLTAATPFELAPTIAWLEKSFEQPKPGVFTKGSLDIHLRITGIGMMATAWQLASYFAGNKPDLSINAGIAGAIDKKLALGDVVHVITEELADLGVEEADGAFTDLFDLNLLQTDDVPFSEGKLKNPIAERFAFLPTVAGITVNKVHGSQASIQLMRQKYPLAQVESMEGAAFFYGCLNARTPFVQLRAISNYVEPRNRAAWEIPLAINNLNTALQQMLEGLS